MFLTLIPVEGLVVKWFAQAGLHSGPGLSSGHCVVFLGNAYSVGNPVAD